MKELRLDIKKIFIINIGLILGILFFFNGNSLEVSAASKKPSKVVINSVKSSDYNAIKVTWKKASNAEKYQVYRATSKNGTYKLIKTTTARSYINKGLTTGTKYYYKVRAVNGSRKGAYSVPKYATPSLKKVTNVTCSKTSSSVTLKWNKVNGASGYQIYRANKKAGTYKKIATVTTATYKNEKLESGVQYYYKIRAYRKVGETTKVGAFSTIKTCKTKYTYELYYLDDYSNKDFYSNCSKLVIYIKTNDPDKDDFDFVSSKGEYADMGYPQDYVDLENMLSDKDDLYEYYEDVPGGYICMVGFEKVGTYEVKFVKHKDEKSKYWGAAYANYDTIKTFTLKCLNYDTYFTKWLKALVANNTTDEMNSLEKMQAVTNYLVSDEAGFTYDTVYYKENTTDLEYAYLAIGEKAYDQPFWVKKSWNSYVSPAMLKKIADYIGGFDSVENLYGKYAYGTAEWSKYHYICRVVYEGEEYDFKVCPLSYTGLLDSIPKYDITDISWMYKIN